MNDEEDHFTGSFKSLFRYWQDEERAKKFQQGSTRSRIVRFLLDKAEAEIHKGVWIDTATGAGYVQSQLYHTVLPNLLIGVDFSRSMLELVDEPVERVLASTFNLPFRKSSANITTNIFCLSDYPDPSSAFAEMSRVTKSRGVIFYLDYSDLDQYWSIRQKEHGKEEIIGNIHLRNPNTIQQYIPDTVRIVQNAVIDYEVAGNEFDGRINLPETVKRAFLLVEMYKPRSE